MSSSEDECSQDACPKTLQAAAGIAVAAAAVVQISVTDELKQHPEAATALQGTEQWEGGLAPPPVVQHMCKDCLEVAEQPYWQAAKAAFVQPGWGGAWAASAKRARATLARASLSGPPPTFVPAAPGSSSEHAPTGSGASSSGSAAATTVQGSTQAT